MILTRALTARRLKLALTTLLCTFAVPAAALADTTADLSVFSLSLNNVQAATVGDAASYSYLVFNAGPDAATVTAVETLGDAEELVSVTASQGQCAQAAPIVCSLGPVAAGSSVNITVEVRFTKASSTNTHRVQLLSDGNTDPNPADNEASVVSPVTDEREPVTPDTPEVATGSWSRTQSRLKISADVTAYGAGKVFFEYGNTTRYGSKTAEQAVSGDRRTTVKAELANLKMNTEYHYRAVLVVNGKTYRGRDVKGRTLGKLKYGPLTLKAVSRRANSVAYTGKLGDGLADAPGACQGKITVNVYTLQGADLLSRSARLKRDCTYKITIPFGRAQAGKYGKRGSVLTQAEFSGNKAVSRVGSTADRP